MERKIISRNEVNENNKLEFFNQESRNVSRILEIEAFGVELAPEVKDAELTVKGEKMILRFNPNVSIEDAFVFIPNIGRQIWRFEKGLLNNGADCTVFAIEYLMYVHKYRGHGIRVNFPEDKELEDFVNRRIALSWTIICMFGNGYEEKCCWIERVRNGEFV